MTYQIALSISCFLFPLFGWLGMIAAKKTIYRPVTSTEGQMRNEEVERNTVREMREKNVKKIFAWYGVLTVALFLIAAITIPTQLLIGVNCRDLTTLEVMPGRLEQLASLLPDDVPRVAESGVTSAADAGRVAIMGYDVALVGGALMDALEPLPLVRAMVSAGRTERARRS